MRLLLIALGLALVLAAPAGAALPSAPQGWPDTLQLGLLDKEDKAAELRGQAPLGFRYQYLSGGVNTGRGWATWRPDGAYASDYAADSIANGFTPVFSYYQLLQSNPAAGGGDESEAFRRNLADGATRKAWLEDLELLFRRLAPFAPNRVVVHVEPDLWGYAQKRTGKDVASATLRNLARSAVALRDQIAPNVLLGYHLSDWGTNVDLAINEPPSEAIDGLASRSARFYASLGADFDLIFAEFSNRDSGLRINQGDGNGAWWNAGDFARHAKYLHAVSEKTRRRIVLWQIPLGHRGLPNTWKRFQDNRVQWLFGQGRARDYVRAGVVGMLFGAGQDGGTCACDHDGDGSDEDGGFFKVKVRDYVAAGPLTLP